MADGYARASGKTGVVIVAISACNAMTQMVNSWKDQIPILVAVASVEQDALGRDLTQETDHGEVMTRRSPNGTGPQKRRREFRKPPARHEVRIDRALRAVFLSLPTNVLRGQAKAAIWDQAKFDVPMRIRPDKDDIEKTARALMRRATRSSASATRSPGVAPRRSCSSSPSCSACRSPGSRSRSATGRGRSRPASALCRRAAARHALSGQARCAAQSRQQIRRTGLPWNKADLDPR